MKLKKNLEKKLDLDINEKYKALLKIPSPYIIENNIRFHRGTLNFVSDKISILARSNLNNTTIYSNISECSKELKLDRAKIKSSLIKGNIYKNYTFKFIDTFSEQDS